MGGGGPARKSVSSTQSVVCTPGAASRSSAGQTSLQRRRGERRASESDRLEARFSSRRRLHHCTTQPVCACARARVRARSAKEGVKHTLSAALCGPQPFTGVTTKAFSRLVFVGGGQGGRSRRPLLLWNSSQAPSRKVREIGRGNQRGGGAAPPARAILGPDGGGGGRLSGGRLHYASQLISHSGRLE